MELLGHPLGRRVAIPRPNDVLYIQPLPLPGFPYANLQRKINSYEPNVSGVEDSIEFRLLKFKLPLVLHFDFQTTTREV